METEKIIIEFPAGKTTKEKQEILHDVAKLIDKSLPRRRIEEAIRSLRNSVWPEGFEVTFTDTNP